MIVESWPRMLSLGPHSATLRIGHKRHSSVMIPQSLLILEKEQVMIAILIQFYKGVLSKIPAIPIRFIMMRSIIFCAFTDKKLCTNLVLFLIIATFPSIIDSGNNTPRYFTTSLIWSILFVFIVQTWQRCESNDLVVRLS